MFSYIVWRYKYCVSGRIGFFGTLDSLYGVNMWYLLQGLPGKPGEQGPPGEQGKQVSFGRTCMHVPLQTPGWQSQSLQSSIDSQDIRSFEIRSHCVELDAWVHIKDN